MRSKKSNKKRRGTGSAEDLNLINTSLKEDDALKVIRKHKFELDDPKNPTSSYVRTVLENFKLILEGLVKEEQVESFDVVGGCRYGYLLTSDLNIDYLVKIYNLDNYENVLEHLKKNYGRLVDEGEGERLNGKEGFEVGLYHWENLNTNNNLLENVIVIELNNKKLKKEVQLKMYFTVVKYDLRKNLRKENINEYLIREMDEVNRKYTNIPNAIILIKLFLKSHNLSPFHLRVDRSEGNLEESSEKVIASLEFNGYMFNVLITHLCLINNYSQDVKAIILFKNTLQFLVNFSKSRQPKVEGGSYGTRTETILYCKGESRAEGADEEEEEVRELIVKEKMKLGGELDKYYKSEVLRENSVKLVVKIEKYPTVNLFKHVQVFLPQLLYFAEIGLNILNAEGSSKEYKMDKLFQQRNNLSNFYENYMLFPTKKENRDWEITQVKYLLKYGLRDRLYLMHVYGLRRYRKLEEERTSQESETDCHYIIYFTFNHNVQSTEDLGPLYVSPSSQNSNSLNHDDSTKELVNESNFEGDKAESGKVREKTGVKEELRRRRLEGEFYKMFWSEKWKLTKTYNNIQYYVDLRELGSSESDLTKSDRGEGRGRRTKEEGLLLEGGELGRNVNVQILNHIERNIVDRKWRVLLSNFNVKYPLITDFHKSLISGTNELVDLITGLEEVPLKILNVHVLNEAYSYCNLYNWSFGPELTLEGMVSEKNKRIKLLIKWESSNRWPREREACEKTVLSLLVAMAKELKRKYKLESVLKNNRLFVYYNHIYEIISLNHYNSQLVNNHYSNNYLTDSSAGLENDYKLMETCRNSVMTNLSFISCIRLLKIFFNKYVKVDLKSWLKLLCLEVYGENNFTKCPNGTVQFLQLLNNLYFHHSTIHNISNSNNNNSNNTNNNNTSLDNNNNNMNNNKDNNNNNYVNKGDNAGLLRMVYGNLKADVRNRLARHCRALLREVNRSLTTIVEISEEGKEVKSGQRSLVEESKLKRWSDLESYNFQVQLVNVYSGQKEGEGGVEETIRRIRNNLQEIAFIYYYKYELFNSFNVKRSKTLNLYIGLDKFKFVPRCHFRQNDWPQSVISVSHHLSQLSRLNQVSQLNELSGQNRRRNNLVKLTGKEENWEIEGKIVIVPNVVLILKLLTLLTGKNLYNIVIS